MKKAFSLILALSTLLTLTACGGQSQSSTSTPDPVQPPASSQPQQNASTSQSQPNAATSSSQEGESDAEDSDVLVAYFTYGENAPLPDGIDATTSASIQYRSDELTGNTGLVASMIADATGGNLFSILTVEQYPDNYNDTIDVGQDERNSNVRPELSSHIEDLDRYNTVFLGFPNWWGDMPMAVYSFLDEYDLSGKTIVPFVTSGGSGFSNTISAIESAEPNATVLEGLSLRDNRSPQAEDDVADWLARLGLAG